MNWQQYFKIKEKQKKLFLIMFLVLIICHSYFVYDDFLAGSDNICGMLNISVIGDNVAAVSNADVNIVINDSVLLVNNSSGDIFELTNLTNDTLNIADNKTSSLYENLVMNDSDDLGLLNDSLKYGGSNASEEENVSGMVNESNYCESDYRKYIHDPALYTKKCGLKMLSFFWFDCGHDVQQLVRLNTLNQLRYLRFRFVYTPLFILPYLFLSFLVSKIYSQFLLMKTENTVVEQKDDPADGDSDKEEKKEE